MQNMIENLISDMWTNIDDIITLNVMQDMIPNEIGLQMLDYQKRAFYNTYDAILKIQQQTEKQIESLLVDNPVVSEEWMATLKKNQEAMKKSIDDGFSKAELYFSAANRQEK